jgi:Phage integrase family
VQAWQETLTTARFGPGPTAVPSLKLAPGEYQQLVDATLAEAADLENDHLRGDKARKLLQRTTAEFEGLLATAYDDVPTAWKQCTPADVLVYLVKIVPVLHKGASGGPVVATTLEGIRSSLSRCFLLRERGGAWDAVRGSGNPARAHCVSSYLEAYRRERHSKGDRETSAVPVSAAKYQALMDAVTENVERETADLRHAPGVPAELSRLLRDAALFSFLWHSKRRGQDVLEHKWSGMYLQCGTDLVHVSEAWTGGPLYREQRCTHRLVCQPDRVKTAQAKRPASVLVAPVPLERPEYCAVQWLRTYFTWQLDNGQDVSGDQAVFHSSRAGSALTSQAVSNRFKTLLKRYELDDGETVHGLRRGAMQDAVANGVSINTVMQQASMVTPEVCAKYLDVGRHL